MVEFDYSALIGFIYMTEKLHSISGFARYLGITRQGVDAKLKGKATFNQREILKLKIDFNLTAEQIDRYFFTPKLLKRNGEEE